MVGSLMPLLLLVVVGIAIFAWYRKRKAKREANPFLSSRRNKDEVWKTIKQFLKDNNEQGKEIVDSYVCKRDHVDMVNPNGSHFYKKNKNYELKIRRWQRKQINQENKLKGKPELTPPKARDLFVVVFETRDSKTGMKDTPRCFECEVLNIKKNKKEFDRRIVINGELNYDVEMEWIAPVRFAEAEKAAAIEKKRAKQKEIERKKEIKRRLRVEKRQKKHAK